MWQLCLCSWKRNEMFWIAIYNRRTILLINRQTSFIHFFSTFSHFVETNQINQAIIVLHSQYCLTLFGNPEFCLSNCSMTLTFAQTAQRKYYVSPLGKLFCVRVCCCVRTLSIGYMPTNTTFSPLSLLCFPYHAHCMLFWTVNYCAF